MKSLKKETKNNLHHECQFRSMMEKIGDKWSVFIILTLEKAPAQTYRFSELKKNVPGISQRMLTLTLRSLERDGLISRKLYPEVPPRVEYQLTKLGQDLMIPMRTFFAWMEDNYSKIQTAQERYDKANE